MSIGKMIFLLRSERGLRQKDFASLLDVSPSTIGMWETDKRQPDLDALVKIADYFEVTTDFLLSRNSNSNMIDKDRARNLKGLDKIDNDMFTSFKELNLDNKYIILGETMKLLKEQRHEESTDILSGAPKTAEELEELVKQQKFQSKIG